jgi:hypothetical protein
VSEARTRAVFFPYIFGDETLRVELTDCQLDGKTFDAGWNVETMECDLSPASPWDSGLLRFKVSRDPSAMWIPDLVPSSERKKPPVKLIASTHCGATFRREKCEGSLDVKGETGQLEISLTRQNLVGFVDVHVFVVRASAQSVEPHLAEDAAARIIAARRVMIRIDAPERRLGPGLNIEWESFKGSKHPYRAAHAGVLFHLDTSRTEPILFLNKDADPDLQAILTDEAPRGKKAGLRNVLFAAIAFPVWTCLVRTALVAVDADGHIEPGWQKNVLAEVAVIAEPACDREEALRRFIRDLKDPSGGHGIEERLPVIIAELVNFRKKAEDLAGVIS